MPLISDSIGKVLGNRYRLVAALGSGASAHVYLAEDVSLQRRVAVKVLQPALAREEGFLKRFRAEARSVASLNHPHILRVFDWGEDVDGPYLVTEYLGGGSLRDILDRRVRLSPAQAARLGAETARGLGYAHARGLVHRDVKPANLLFDEEGRVRIADFGVARALAEAAWTEPSGAMIGTARYASPEQAQALPVDGRSDVYSLALVLFESLTGRVPFVADTTVGTLMARVGVPLPRHPGLGRLDDTLVQAAHPEVARRLEAAELATRLEVVAAGLEPPAPLPLQGPGGEATLTRPGGGVGVDAPEPTMSGTVVGDGGPKPFDVEELGADVAPAADPGPPPLPPVVAGRSGRRRRWPWAAAVLAAVGAVLAVLVTQGAFTPSRPTPVLKGTSLAVSRAALARDHLDLEVETAVYSITVPAGWVVSQEPAPGIMLKEGSTVSVVPSKGVPSVNVPSLSGLTCDQATRVLSAAHLKAACPVLQSYEQDIPAGYVINWSYRNHLEPKTAPYGATIGIATSQGPPPRPVPAVTVGGSYQDAAGLLTGAGFSPTEAQQYSASVAAGGVIGTSPAAGSTEPYGSTVTIDVSQGPQTVKVPDLGGDSVSEATSALQKVGLSVGPVYGPNRGTVFSSNPVSGAQANVGSSVDLYTLSP